MTRSSYARTVRELSRSQSLGDAPEIFAIDESHVLAYVSHDPTPGFERDLAHDVIDFYNSKTFIRQGDGDGFTLMSQRMSGFQLHRQLGAVFPANAVEP